MATVIFLISIVWGASSIVYAQQFTADMIPWIVVDSVLILLFALCLVIGLNLWAKKTNARLESEDERSDNCSLKATRNAFIIALLLMALYMVIGQMSPDSLYRTQALQGVFGVSVAAYTFSYFYYLYTV